MNEPLMMPAPIEELERLLGVILKFEERSGRLTGDVGEIGEQWAAHYLGAQLRKNKTRIGWDLYSPAYGHVQVRSRMPDIDGGLPSRVKLTGDYDHLAFVYLDRQYRVQYLQLLTRAEALSMGEGKEFSSPKRILLKGQRIVGQGLDWPPPREGGRHLGR